MYRVPGAATVIAVPVLVIVLLVTATQAVAATASQKLSIMLGWTQATAASNASWNGARSNQAAWAEYGFDWSTDYCSTSPDQPLGFDFRMPCWRHDFGYRNYKAVGQFSANKSRIDDAFYFDLRTKCDTYDSSVRPACDSLAWTYYQAVVVLGDLAVDQASLDRAAALKARGEAWAASKARGKA